MTFKPSAEFKRRAKKAPCISLFVFNSNTSVKLEDYNGESEAITFFELYSIYNIWESQVCLFFLSRN